VTQKALYDAIAICKPGVLFNQVGKVIEKVAGQNGLDVCEHFTGHGVGHLLHMPPMVYHRCNSAMI
jgi:methionyl aminopeptidase